MTPIHMLIISHIGGNICITITIREIEYHFIERTKKSTPEKQNRIGYEDWQWSKMIFILFTHLAEGTQIQFDRSHIHD